MRSLGIVRILVGAIALRHLWPFVDAAVHGNTYQDQFHHAYLSWYPELPEVGYVWLLVLGCLAAAAKVIIATELFIGGGLWWRRTRRFALIAAVAFHITIQFTA